MEEVSGFCRLWQQWIVHAAGVASAGVGAAMTAMARMEAMRIEVRMVVFFMGEVVFDGCLMAVGCRIWMWCLTVFSGFWKWYLKPVI